MSYFETTAKRSGVILSAEASVPEKLSISDTEICSLLSNGLENAIKAASDLSDSDKRTVSVRITVHLEKLLLSIENRFEGKIDLHNGLPQASEEGHGYGSRSISALADRRGGQALFSADGGVFSLKVMIPLKKNLPENP